jgi:hypothetical protein
MALHLTKVAFGATSYADLVRRVTTHSADGMVRMTTRFLPKRHDEIVAGGSLYWIIKHQLVGRAKILGFEATPEGRHHIVLEAKLVPVSPHPRRAHQGWRYLEAADAPSDLGTGDIARGDELPETLLRELAELSLI